MPEGPTPKVCLAVPMPPPYGGIANWSRMVITELQRQGVPFEVVNTAPRRRSVDGRSAYDRFIMSGIDMIRIAAQVARAARNECRVLHITTSGQFAIVRDLLLLWLARRLRISSVYHVRFGRIPEIREQATWEWRWFRRAASLATMTVAIDQATFHVLREELGAEMVTRIPNPVDLGTLPQVVLNPEKSVVYLGWVIRSKGMEDLLIAWNDFFIEHGDWELKLIGPIPDSYRAHLAGTFCLDGVKFFGEMDHEAAMQEVAQSSIFVLPSHTEGFPNVLLEAMAMGRASVATSVGAIPEMLDGGAGHIVSPCNPRELLGALRALCDNSPLRLNLGERARAKVVSDYALDYVLKQYLRTWEEVAR